MGKIVYPEYFRTVKKEGSDWYFRHPRVFYRQDSTPVEVENREEKYGLTKWNVVIELFRINGGKDGYYLVNLRDKEYYYCGLDFGAVKQTLLKLGIGKADPLSDEVEG